MKREMDLVRKILLKIEDGFKGTTNELYIEGYEQDVVQHHIMLLHEAGLLTSPDSVHAHGEKYRFYASPRLTWAGHDWINAARDDGTWKQAMERAGDKAGSLTFGVIKELLTAIMRANLGLG